MVFIVKNAPVESQADSFQWIISTRLGETLYDEYAYCHFQMIHSKN